MKAAFLKIGSTDFSEINQMWILMNQIKMNMEGGGDDNALGNCRRTTNKVTFFGDG